MALLRIQHHVPDFDRWKRSFDSDRADRRGSGVVRYSIFRSVSDPHLVMIDLEFQTQQQAEVLLTKMRRIWSGSSSPISSDADADAWIVDMVEQRDLA